MNFHIDFGAMLSTLPVMGMGWGGIFLVIGLIMAAIWLFNRFSSPGAEE
ncbi:MAG: oxaloacetate decarboxylase [Christensenellaceae bacterium]|nr:oxaloacetate decarboxylase [Christensenellaceae bacterium]